MTVGNAKQTSIDALNIGPMAKVGKWCCALSVICVLGVVVGAILGGCLWGMAGSSAMWITGKTLVFGACVSVGVSLLACCLCSCCCCAEGFRLSMRQNSIIQVQ